MIRNGIYVWLCAQFNKSSSTNSRWNNDLWFFLSRCGIITQKVKAKKKLIALFRLWFASFYFLSRCLLFHSLENRNLTTHTLSEMKGTVIKSMHNNYENTHNHWIEDIHLFRTVLKLNILHLFATVSLKTSMNERVEWMNKQTESCMN